MTLPGPDVPRKADDFVVSCIDPRLTDDTTFLMAALGRTDRYSEMRIAGAALAAVDESRPAWMAALWENFEASRRLHGVQRVVFINYRDCGAMNLWAGRRLAEDPADELRQHQAVLERAAAAVRARFPAMAVEIRLMELDGSARLLPCTTCAATPGLQAEAVEPPSSADSFTELVRLRTADALPDPAAERALLVEGVTRYGLTAARARAVLEVEMARHGQRTARQSSREIAVFLRAQADRRGRVAERDAQRAAELYRGVRGRQATPTEAQRRVAAVMAEEGLAARPRGLLRSTAWLRRMAAG